MLCLAMLCLARYDMLLCCYAHSQDSPPWLCFGGQLDPKNIQESFQKLTNKHNMFQNPPPGASRPPREPFEAPWLCRTKLQTGQQAFLWIMHHTSHHVSWIMHSAKRRSALDSTWWECLRHAYAACKSNLGVRVAQGRPETSRIAVLAPRHHNHDNIGPTSDLPSGSRN